MEKTKEEIFQKHMKLTQMSHTSIYNAMQEYATQQTESLREELEYKNVQFGILKDAFLYQDKLMDTLKQVAEQMARALNKYDEIGSVNNNNVHIIENEFLDLKDEALTQFNNLKK